nr:E3 SUMO-protein ligase ZBED1-like [Nothobranchius furzeri]
MATGDGGESGKFVPKKGIKSSVVWNWYGFAVTDIKQETPRCNLCLKPVAIKGSSTTNLFQHLKQRHPAEHEKCQSLRDEQSRSDQEPVAKKQLTVAESFAQGTAYDKKGARWTTITDAVALYIAKDMVPIYTMDKTGFINLMKTLDPRYELPSRKYFSEVVLPQMYRNTRKKVGRELEELSFFSATTDMWSSRTMQPYMSLTVHFINNAWDLRSISLQTSYFPEDHTGELIAKGLRDALDCWNLSENRLSCMTTDSGTNMIKALKVNGWPNLQCFGHKLHNAIENGVKDPRIDRAIGVCKKIVAAFSYSWKKRRELGLAQSELGLPPHQLIVESPTRWGSRQKMIERFLEQEKAIARVLGSEVKSRHLVPSWQDIEVLESVNKAVKALQDFTDALSGEMYVSVSYIKPVIHLFKTSLLQPEDNDTELTKTTKSNILGYLVNKYSNPVKDELLDMASLMDPRFRTSYIDPDKVEQIKRRAVSELLSFPTDKSTPQPGPVVQVDQEARPQPNHKRKKNLAAFFKKSVPTPGPDQSEETKIETELATYLLMPEVDPDTDPLQWWKSNKSNFSRLSHLAKKYLSIPATSAPSERLFSVAGGVVTRSRACLKPEAVDRLIFLAKNV